MARTNRGAGVPSHGGIPVSAAGVAPTIAAELVAAARDHADATALRCEGRTLTFARLAAEVRAAASGLLARGLTPGDRVAVWAPNVLDAAIALYAIPVAGGIAVPLNPRYQPREVAEIVGAAECALLLAPARFRDRDYAAEAARLMGREQVVAFGPDGWGALLAAGRAAGPAALAERAARASGDDVVVIQYTSGTTGRPKGAALRQGPMLATAAAWAGLVGLRPDDTYPVTYPLAHVGGFKTGLLTSMIARATAVLSPVQDSGSLVAMVAALRPGVLSAPPPVLRSLLGAADRGELGPGLRIRTVVTGSAIVPPSMVRELAQTFGTQDVIVAYGLTEATGVCTMTRRGDPVERVCESIGTPIPGVEVRIVGDGRFAGDDGPDPAVGEIQVRRPNVMSGYWRDPAATAAVMDGGWLRTGDLGWIDPGGYVHIAGRAKDMVIVGGFNVYPAEVEHVLAAHPDVAEASAIGIPDPRLGEVVAAFVVAAPGARADEAALLRWCQERLANFKVPRHVWTVAALPRGAVGKVAKAELSALAVAAHGLVPELGCQAPAGR